MRIATSRARLSFDSQASCSYKRRPSHRQRFRKKQRLELDKKLFFRLFWSTILKRRLRRSGSSRRSSAVSRPKAGRSLRARNGNSDDPGKRKFLSLRARSVLPCRAWRGVSRGEVIPGRTRTRGLFPSRNAPSVSQHRAGSAGVRLRSPPVGRGDAELNILAATRTIAVAPDMGGSAKAPVTTIPRGPSSSTWPRARVGKIAGFPDGRRRRDQKSGTCLSCAYVKGVRMLHL